jgi:hypothetical protein
MQRSLSGELVKILCRLERDIRIFEEIILELLKAYTYVRAFKMNLLNVLKNSLVFLQKFSI